jgi:ABC-type antimicrobial peptide transport system permease subunit
MPARSCARSFRPGRISRPAWPPTPSASSYTISPIQKLLADLNGTQTVFPGTKLTLVSNSSQPDFIRIGRSEDVDPRVRIVETTNLEQLIDQKLAREALVADLAGFFAALTLMLVVPGVYGAVAYSVATRTKEIGTRIAPGARRANVTGVVLRHLMVAISAGLIVGIAVAMAVGRLFRVLLFDVTATDVRSIGGAGLILCLAALIAGYLPVRRAWRLDLTTALRLE